MGGPGDPPEGTPEGSPSGAEDEYRSVVFDESFVRAARLQEYSAHERMTDHAPAVRRRGPRHRRLVTRQALALVVLLAIAFGTALYMGVRHPYGSPQARRSDESLRTTVVPLAPRGEVPGAADARTLFERSPAAPFASGIEGVPLPAVRATAHFSESQVQAALTTARTYLVRSSLDPDVLAGRAVRPVRALLDAGQLGQFDRSMNRPAPDGRHAATGWLIRFDPARAVLADDRIRVLGTLRAVETDAATLEISSDSTFVYALRPRGSTRATAQVSLFTVRRALTFRFDSDNLRVGQTRLVSSSTQAGPLSCAEDTSARLHPLLAGQTARPGGPAVTDPYTAPTPTALCGTLSDAAQPKP
ncbi:hypothetical protein IF655_30600 [Streptomyces sp. DSM 110735]|uniref:SCO2583 family membrane protein n=1 Tax=Streptomyces sp. DSM 110735 TaxID=2775031 RepID=UPI0018F7B863|nr:hypothetical protein [Streptomyces sp. DSM 110735]MBJ7907640.1 hypothetical protein [Streptomyces sp. DSM 110735]